MKLPYCEGTVFAVPLVRGGFGLGVAARIRPRGPMLLAYLFGPKWDTIPQLYQVGILHAKDAVLVGVLGDLALIRRTWPIIGHLTSWKRDEWPMPPMVRRDPLSNRAWRVTYSDSDPNHIVSEAEIESAEADGLIDEGLMGSGYVEIVLTKLLDPEVMP